MKTLLVARKNLLEILREPQLLLLELLLPLVFLVIAAFTYTAPLQVTHPILVDSAPEGAPLAAAFEAQRYPDTSPVFDVAPVTDFEMAETALKEQDVTALVTIASGDSGRLSVTIQGDALFSHFYRAGAILDGIIGRYADRVAGRPEVVRVVEQPLFNAGPQNEFDLYAPGIMIMALLMIIPQTAMLVARELRWKTLRRLRLTRLRAWDLLGGVSLAQLVVAVAQVVVIILVALALGFHNRGSLLLALVVGLVIAFSAIGLGLIVACFVENDSQAANVGSTLTMVQVFLSGSFYQFPPLTLFTLLGHQIDLFDVFPATHGFLALQQVLTYGAGLREIGFRLAATLLLSAVYFFGGVVIFQKLQMRDSRE